MIVDDISVIMSKKEFNELSEYSCSIPTGTAIGKRWKRGEPYMGPKTHWYLGEFVEINDKTQVGIKFREIIVQLSVIDIIFNELKIKFHKLNFQYENDYKSIICRNESNHLSICVNEDVINIKSISFNNSINKINSHVVCINDPDCFEELNDIIKDNI